MALSTVETSIWNSFFAAELNRIQFLRRWLVSTALWFGLVALMAPLRLTGDVQFFTGIVLGSLYISYQIFGMVLPRLGHLRWSEHRVFLLLVPVVNGVFILLLFTLPGGADSRGRS